MEAGCVAGTHAHALTNYFKIMEWECEVSALFHIFLATTFAKTDAISALMRGKTTLKKKSMEIHSIVLGISAVLCLALSVH